MWRGCVASLLLLMSPVVLRAEPLRIVAWNAESGGEADPVTLAERALRMPEFDIWVFTEVRGRAACLDLKWGVEAASGRPYDYVISRSGRGEKMVLLYDRTKLDCIEKTELDDLNDGQHRSPLVAKMRFGETEFLLMVNHLADEKKSLKEKQCAGLNAWVREQTLPVIATGVYYLDWAVTEGERKHDEGFDVLTRDAAWTWVRPSVLVRTQHTPANAVEDFIFAAGLPEGWEATSEILLEAGDFPDNEETSDHRPVAATVAIP